MRLIHFGAVTMPVPLHQSVVGMVMVAVQNILSMGPAIAETAAVTKAESWNWQAIGIIATGFVGILGFLATYWNNILLEKQRANIAFISNQLEKLYGPLLALSNSTEQAWRQFQTRHRPGRPFFFDDGDPPSEEEAREFRHWMTVVLMPTNIKMQEVISQNAHLIDGSSMPTEFLEFLAHVQAYRAVIAKWAVADTGPALTSRAANASYLNYPQKLDAYVAAKFDELKARQERLLAKRFAR